MLLAGDAESAQPDVHLVASLVALSGVIPQENQGHARRWCAGWSMS